MIPLPPAPPSQATLFEWCRKVAGLINQLISRQTFAPSATAPLNPRVGDGYFDTTDSKAKMWTGSAWQDLF